MYSKIMTAVAISLLFSASVAAQGNSGGGGGNSGGGTPGNGGGNASGFVSESFTFVDTSSTTAVFMGMSDNTPPNARAAASQGTRTDVITVTTTYEIDATGPKGQIEDYELPADYEVQVVGADLPGCANCEITAIEESSGELSVETTDLPGANR